jgi:replication fork clamp-binding protein CrfC
LLNFIDNHTQADLFAFLSSLFLLEFSVNENANFEVLGDGNDFFEFLAALLRIASGFLGFLEGTTDAEVFQACKISFQRLKLPENSTSNTSVFSTISISSN